MVAWEVQSQLAAITLVSLIAFVSMWAALPAMLAWSLVAHVLYWAARQRGLPDLVTVEAPKRGSGPTTFLRHVAGSAIRIWCVGLHNLIFARVAGCALCPGQGFAARTRRLGILSLGMTLFGVTTAHHLLRRAGFSGPSLLYRGLFGPFLNVPYRIFLSAAVIHAVVGAARAVSSLQGNLL